ncbi:hypothetical protein [Mycobacterium sp. shizuoka-1]|uniref:hypothetical protein n=1 Tax=Mycobacterium sp. shizuoka-1 TaxID=2039281 RepID=UPI000C0678BE|nr:hypothetical protein [Mycobacterium sp. shizuoka-1]GAY18497.1 hypothetical protein MSZK_52230 [Mycobacterium sp. shizuoka-1]
MEHPARRPLFAVATLTTTGALALTPVIVTPPDLHPASMSPVRISTEAIVLTDAWSDLASNTVSSVYELGKLALGTNNSFPLPSPTFPLAPVVTQLVLNQLIYATQLLTGKAGQIPGEISTHVTELFNVLGEVAAAVPAIIPQQLYVPIYAIQQAFTFVAGSANPLAALVQAPAVFLDITLNADAGLLGQYGPIGLPLIVRNLIAKALYTPPPTITLPFKKPSAAALRSTAAVTTKATPSAPSGTASSARSKPKASAAGNRKAASAKAAGNPAGKPGTGQGHSKRG